MDRTLREAAALAFLAAGCVLSTPSHAYSATDDAEAQDREVKAAYDRGYKAARDELAREASTKQSPAAGTPPAAAAPAQKSAAAAATPATPARKPILDIKHVYSDTSDVESVQEVPVVTRPLPEPQSTQTAATNEAHVAPPQPTARRTVAAATDTPADPEPMQNQQPVRRASAQMRDAGPTRATGRAVQHDVAPPEEMADDDVDDAAPPRAAQVYSTEPQYARPRAQYAPQAAAMRQPPQQYGYVQQPAYAAPRPYSYYSAPAPWADAYRPMPQAGGWYWSPEYGRWLYY